MSNWYSRAPIDVADNAQQREVVLVDRRGAPLLLRQPRPVGFREPKRPRHLGGEDGNEPAGRPPADGE